MISRDPINPFDVILISGDYWADHPHSGVGVIARVLEDMGLDVGIIEKPDWRSTADFKRLGLPRMFFGVTSGAIDSMLVNYTPLKKKRSEDPYNPYESHIPDRAVVVYSQRLKEAQKELIKIHLEDFNQKIEPRPIILGGVEASLRRFTHYDYWDNKLRRPILFDAKADLLVFGSGEYQIREIARRLLHKENLISIEGTCIIGNSVEMLNTNKIRFSFLPSHQTLETDKLEFCNFSLALSNKKTLVEPVGDKFLIQYRMHDYTSQELDGIYNLPFSYKIPPEFKEFDMALFSTVTHRGCVGKCNFCSIALHQGDKIISRSIDNILDEIRKMVSLTAFKGYIYDVGGPSANMYGMDCEYRSSCEKSCIDCKLLDRSHQKAVTLLREIRATPGVKKAFVRSGIRYDMVVDSLEYLIDLSKYHISGTLKIAPEHFSPKICELMNKPNDRFEEFKEKFDEINTPLKQNLRFYLMAAHPGSTIDDSDALRKRLLDLGVSNPEIAESIQVFTPSPMSISTCMYYTGLNPYTLEPVYVPYAYSEKKLQKKALYQGSKKPKISSRKDIKKKK